MPRKSTTRAAAGAGTIRQRPDGRWEARYTVGRDAGTGKQVQRSVYGATQAEVRKRLHEIAVDLDHGTYVTPQKMTLGQWLETWRTDYLGAVKDSTKEQYTHNIKTNILPRLGGVRLQELSPHMIQNLYNSLMKPHSIQVKDKKTGKQIKKELSPLTAKSIRNIHGTLHKALKQSVLLGYIHINPADAVVLPRVEKREVGFLHDESVPRFLEAIQGHRYENVYRVALFSGLRQGEILGLTWDAVDFEKGILRVDKQLQGFVSNGEYSFSSPKNGKARRVSVTPFVLDVLKQERQKQRLNRLRAGQVWGNHYDLVFSDELGIPLSRRTVYSCFKRIAAQIGLPELRFHDLRHSFAMLSLQNGDDVKTVQEAVGHATAAFTLDVYGHVSQRMKQESVDRMQAYIDSLEIAR